MIVYNCNTIKIGNSVHLGPMCQSQTSTLLVFPTRQVYPLGYSVPLVQTLGALLLGQVAGAVWLVVLG